MVISPPRYLVLLLSLFIIHYSLFIILASPVLAQNKIGINLGDHFNEFDRAAEIVGNGGWIVLMACPGDADKIATLANSYPEINIVIRGHYPGQRLDYNWALSWVGTLGNLPSPNKIYFMPWNEPNQTGSHDWGEPGEVISYINHLTTFLNEAGLRRSKVKLLSPMVNQTHPNFSSYIQQLGRGAFFSQFDNVAMNLYDFDIDEPNLNAARFEEVLAQIGASGKKVFAVESGVVDGSSVRYTDSLLHNFYQRIFPVWHPKQNFVMSAVFSYDPEHEEPWSIYGTNTAALFQTTSQQQGPCCTETAASSWNQSFITNHNLVVCSNGITVGPNESYCGGCAAPIQPRLSCPTPATDEIDSRPNMCDPCISEAPTYPFCATTPTASQAFSFPASAGPELSFTLDGTFSLNSSSLKIPFVGKKGEEQKMEYIADYFEGFPKDLRSGVFRKLAPQATQDRLKREMIFRASGFAPNPVHDYLVTNYDGEKARLSEFLNNMKPESRLEQTIWETKDGGKWYRLWPFVPMFTREDSPGQVTLAVEPPGTTSNPGPFEIQVPHVARLYEITKVLSQLLMPNLSGESLSGESLNSPNLLNTLTSPTAFSRFPSSLAPLASSNNLLTNPNFEEGFSERGAGEITVANNWDPWYRAYEGPGQYHRPEYKPEDGEIFTDPLRICSNRFAQKFFTTYSTHEAGFYQRASVPSGSQVTFSIWGLAWSSAQDNPKSCAETGNYSLSVGIDPTGGTDPYSANIVWSNPSLACNIPVLLSVSATAQGSTVTVFTKGAPEWSVKHNDSYWDNACLVVGTTSDLPTNCFACNATGGGGIAECEYPEATTGEGDPICVGGETGKTISSRITATDTIHHEPEISNETKTHTVSRKIGITFHHPYLKEIWQQTTEAAKGLFNIFRLSNPELAPPPSDETPAYGTVEYSFSGGDINKTEGKVYFPFLEAIRRIKEWVADEALAPSVSEGS